VNKITSSDGTTIAFDRPGAGPAVVIIGAGPTDRNANAPVAQLLANSFTVVNYDRRARGQSGDNQPFSVDASTTTWPPSSTPQAAPPCCTASPSVAPWRWRPPHAVTTSTPCEDRNPPRPP
jgi:hypothetical protein